MCASSSTIGRRALVMGLGATAAGSVLSASEAAEFADLPTMPVIDTHIHLFDPNRPQGAPYRGPKTEPFYTQGALPDTYERLSRDLGVVGAIKVEASPWFEDNLWILEAARRNPVMVGVIGNMQPDAPDFLPAIARFARDPLFLGVRYGNLWAYDLPGRGGTPAFVAGVRGLAEAGLVLDSANPGLNLLQALVRLHDAVPALRIVIDHLPHYDPAPAEEAAYRSVLREIGARPTIFVKLSEIIHPVGGVTRRDLGAYRDRLDRLYATFGENRVLFGSDWPNILADAPLADVFAVARAFMAAKTREQQAKFFWRNSLAAYRWRPRNDAQTRLAAA